MEEGGQENAHKGLAFTIDIVGNRILTGKLGKVQREWNSDAAEEHGRAKA